MKKKFLFFFFVIFILIFFLNQQLSGQNDPFFSDFLNSFGYFSNPALYSFDYNLYSFSFIYSQDSYIQFSINLANSILLSIKHYNQDELNWIFIGIPLIYRFKNYPVSLGFIFSNKFLSIGYYFRSFGFLENGFVAYYPLDTDVSESSIIRYEVLLGFKFSKKIILSSNIFFDNSLFSSSLDIDNVINKFIFIKLNFIYYYSDSNLFSISYSLNNLWEFHFSFNKGFNSFNIFFSFDSDDDSYSFGFSTGKTTKYAESNEKSIIYIIDFNKIKPDARLYLKLRQMFKKKGNIFLFIYGNNIKNLSDIEDLDSIIRELKKNNLCFTYLDKIDILSIAFASSSSYILADKSDYIDLSYKKIENLILKNILSSFENYIRLYISDNELKDKLISILANNILSNENFENYFNQITQYIAELISDNRNLNKDFIKQIISENSIYDFIFAKNNKLIDFIVEEKNIFETIKDICEQQGLKVKRIEELYLDDNRINDDSWGLEKNIAIIYLKGLIVSQESKISNELETITYQKVENIFNKIQYKKYLCLIFIIDSIGGEISEGEKILMLVKNRSEKLPVFILQNSIISSGSYIASIVDKNLYSHKTSLIIPESFIKYFSFLEIVKHFSINYRINYNEENILLLFNSDPENNELTTLFEQLIKWHSDKVKKITQINRDFKQKLLKQINENSIFSGYDAVNMNLVDFIIDFNELIDIIVDKIFDLDESIINFDIIYSDNFNEKESFFKFLSKMFIQIVQYFKK